MKKGIHSRGTDISLNKKKLMIRYETLGSIDKMVRMTPKYNNNLMKILTDNKKLVKEVQLIDFKLHSILHSNLDNYMMLFKVHFTKVDMAKIKEKLKMLKEASEKIKEGIKNSPQIKILEKNLTWFMDESQKLHLQTESNTFLITDYKEKIMNLKAENDSLKNEIRIIANQRNQESIKYLTFYKPSSNSETKSKQRPQTTFDAVFRQKKEYKYSKIHNVLTYLFLKNVQDSQIDIILEKYFTQINTRYVYLSEKMREKIEYEKSLENKLLKIDINNFKDYKNQKFLNLLMSYLYSINNDVYKRRELTRISISRERPQKKYSKLNKTTYDQNFKSDNNNLNLNLKAYSQNDKRKLILMFLFDPNIIDQLKEKVNKNLEEILKVASSDQKDNEENQIDDFDKDLFKSELLKKSEIEKSTYIENQVFSNAELKNYELIMQNQIIPKQVHSVDRPTTVKFQASHLYKRPEVPESLSSSSISKYTHASRLKTNMYGRITKP